MVKRPIKESDLEESDLFIPENGVPFNFIFDNDGMLDTMEIIDEITKKIKERPLYIFDGKVMIDGGYVPKTMSFLSKQVATQIRLRKPLKDKEFAINVMKLDKFRYRVLMTKTS